jgi:hypothetical protein
MAIPRHAAREPSISEGGNRLNEFRCWPPNESRPEGSFTCPKVGIWDRLFYFPSVGKRAVDVLNTEKFNGFGRVRTRELGNQRPAR